MAESEHEETRVLGNNEETQTCSDLIVKCLINEGVKHIFALPGEENADLCIALKKQDQIKVHIVRHEVCILILMY